MLELLLCRGLPGVVLVTGVVTLWESMLDRAALASHILIYGTTMVLCWLGRYFGSRRLRCVPPTMVAFALPVFFALLLCIGQTCVRALVQLSFS